MAKNMMAGLIFALAVLMGGCGGQGAGSNVSTTKGTVPSANAGADQNVNAGLVVTLDGSGSTGAITYIWSFSSKPSGSNASLSDSTAVSPTLTTDVAGTYVLTLIVNDGIAYSTPSNVTIVVSAANIAPVADAGVSQNVLIGSAVDLDASKSKDVNGDVLSYSWSFTSTPSGSISTLTNPTAVNPTFTPDVAGTYALVLIVNDGTANSLSSNVTIVAFPQTTNIAPVADAGVSQNVLIGSTVNLDGSKSKDANGDILSYSWSFKSTPSGSISTLTNPTAVNPTFTPDVSGIYVVELVVNRETLRSASATVSITGTLADQFARGWHGSWSVNGENGTLNFILNDGFVSGTVTNSTFDTSSSFIGTYSGGGGFTAYYQYPNFNIGVIAGDIQLSNPNQMVLNAINSFNSMDKAFITVLTAD